MAATPDPLQSFKYNTLTPIVGQPTRNSIKILEKENRDNAHNIYSTRGTGGEGHLRLCYTTLAEYNARDIMLGRHWVDPVHPGPRADIPPGATAAQIAQRISAYKFDLKEFETFKQTELALLHHAMEAIEEVYYADMEDPDDGYSQVSYIDFIVYLREEHGELSDDDLTKNMQRMNVPWSPSEPIHKLFTQINKARAFARNNDPISEAAAIRSAAINLEKTGVFRLALQEWRRRPAAERDWSTFQRHFKAANKERIRDPITTQDGGFHDQHRANNANQKPNNNTKNPYHVRDMDGNTMAYCWTHGVQWDLSHTSLTCRNRHHDHNEKATQFNMLGGRCNVKRKPGEAAIFKFQPNNDKNKGRNNRNANSATNDDNATIGTNTTAGETTNTGMSTLTP
ncbi:hypothetical protein SEMRO_5_G004200.1 [Seminavis robusta]|uniref:Uncharacterized protein n=1 Tax=Seminavis robusta TaxID=568900 RepID=A0A9N8D783_9STRA|nr:hypothetical protein SEMRO_5_G004200.1 [Seminavis robusta]|eukprot:Sro5_g004200.1 n/a (397) ;mRNA; f:81767-82957